MEIYSLVGWGGMSLILFGYFLISTGKTNPRSMYYQLLNLVGAIGLGVSLWVAASWPAFTLQVAWGLIAAYALLRLRVR